MKTRREKVTLAVCVALHLYILWNVWNASLHTPRVIIIQGCELVQPAPKHNPGQQI